MTFPPRSRRGLLTFTLATALLAPGCLQDGAPVATVDPPAIDARPVNATVLADVPIDYAGNVGRRICLTSPTACFPTGPGIGALSGASENPHTVAVNGTPKAVAIRVEWSASGPLANAEYEVVAYAVMGNGSMGGGGGGGGFGGGGREIGRKAGTSPLVLEADNLSWEPDEGRLRIRLLLPNRLADPAYLGVDEGQAFTVKGNYTAAVPAP